MTAVLEKEVVELNEEVDKSLESHIEVQIRKDLLQDILKRVDRTREKKSVTPIRKGICLFFDENKIVAQASNASFSTKVTIEKDDKNYSILKGQSGGAVFMDTKITSIVNSMPRKNVKITITGTDATISAGRSSFNLKILDHLEFPKFEDPKNGLKLSLHPDVLARMYRKTVFACSSQETRPVLTGVKHEVFKDKLSLVATDAHRLAQIHEKLDEEIVLDEESESIAQVVPSATLNEVQKHLNSGQESVDLYIMERSIVYDFNNGTVLSSRLIEGNYPGTDRLIPNEFLTEAVFKVEHLKDMVNRALLVEEEAPVKLLLKTKERQVRVVSQEAENSGFTEDMVPVKAEGEDLQLGFNIRYLLDVLNHHNPHSLIKIHFLGGLRPFVVKLHDDNSDNLDLILPVRLIGHDESDEVVIEDFRAEAQTEMSE